MANRYSFEDIVDFIGGPVTAWPCKILERYQKASYNNSDRFTLCLFNFTNGFDNRLFLEFAQTNGKLRDEAAAQHIRTIIYSNAGKKGRAFESILFFQYATKPLDIFKWPN